MNVKKIPCQFVEFSFVSKTSLNVSFLTKCPSLSMKLRIYTRMTFFFSFHYSQNDELQICFTITGPDISILGES